MKHLFYFVIEENLHSCLIDRTNKIQVQLFLYFDRLERLQ